MLEAQKEREAREKAKNGKMQKKKEIKAGSALQDADVLLSNPKLTDYHFEPGEKILLYKRPVVVDRTLVSPLASIKEVSPRDILGQPAKTEKKKKQSPDGGAALSRISASIASIEINMVKDLKTVKPIPFE